MPIQITDLGLFPTEHDASCFECRETIIGGRRRCTNCPGYDLCEGCFDRAHYHHDPSHEFVKLPYPGLAEAHLVSCSGCSSGMLITGSRFHCLDCPYSYDLCQECHIIGSHPASHRLVEIREPDKPEVQKATCDACHDRIIGTRSKCRDCLDYDECERCNSSPYRHHNPFHRSSKIPESGTVIQSTIPCDVCQRVTSEVGRMCICFDCPDTANFMCNDCVISSSKTHQAASHWFEEMDLDGIESYIIHDVCCRVCQEGIIGQRHRCLDCDSDYDLCDTCLGDPIAQRSHPLSHRMVEIGAGSNTFLYDLRPQYRALYATLLGGSQPFGQVLSAEPPNGLAPIGQQKVECDVCHKNIVGRRHKCKTCPDYSMCKTCFETSRSSHSRDHQLVNIEAPGLTVYHASCCTECSPTELLAEDCFVCPECPDYQICPKCESKGLHDPLHGLIQIRGPGARDVHAARCQLCWQRIVGARYKCSDCPENEEYSLCEGCFPSSYLDPRHHRLSHHFSPISGAAALVYPLVLTCEQCQRVCSASGAAYECLDCPKSCNIMCADCISLSGMVHQGNFHCYEPIVIPEINPVIVHDAACGQCKGVIMGSRHKCLHCVDYDMCDTCFTGSRNAHPLSHRFFKADDIGRVVIMDLRHLPTLDASEGDQSAKVLSESPTFGSPTSTMLSLPGELEPHQKGQKMRRTSVAFNQLQIDHRNARSQIFSDIIGIGGSLGLIIPTHGASLIAGAIKIPFLIRHMIQWVKLRRRLKEQNIPKLKWRKRDLIIPTVAAVAAMAIGFDVDAMLNGVNTAAKLAMDGQSGMTDLGFDRFMSGMVDGTGNALHANADVVTSYVNPLGTIHADAPDTVNPVGHMFDAFSESAKEGLSGHVENGATRVDNVFSALGDGTVFNYSYGRNLGEGLTNLAAGEAAQAGVDRGLRWVTDRYRPIPRLH